MCMVGTLCVLLLSWKALIYHCRMSNNSYCLLLIIAANEGLNNQTNKWDAGPAASVAPSSEKYS